MCVVVEVQFGTAICKLLKHIFYSPLNVTVTRDGTDYSSVEQRIENVLLQLHAGRVELHFDGETRTCNILSADENLSAGGQNE